MPNIMYRIYSFDSAYIKMDQKREKILHYPKFNSTGNNYTTKINISLHVHLCFDF